ncbi:MAG TPA: hypothetical protein VIV58_28325, partial [Kofleriaceae bacterium]
MRLQHVSIAVSPGSADPARGVGGDLEVHVMLVDEQPPRRAHFCLVVDDDLDALRGGLDRAGVETEDAPLLVGRPRSMC